MIRNILLFISAVLFSVSLFAEEVQTNNNMNVRTGWFASIGAGFGSGLGFDTEGDYNIEERFGNMRIRNNSSRSNTFDADGWAFIPTISFGYEWKNIRLSNKVGINFGLELAVSAHEDKWKSTDFRYFATDDKEDSKLKAKYTDVVLNGYYKINISNLPISPYAGIGLGYSSIKLDWTVGNADAFSGVGAPSNKIDALLLALFAGVQYDINQNMAVTLDGNMTVRSGFECTSTGRLFDNSAIDYKTTFATLNTFSLNAKFKYYL